MKREASSLRTIALQRLRVVLGVPHRVEDGIRQPTLSGKRSPKKALLVNPRQSWLLHMMQLGPGLLWSQSRAKSQVRRFPLQSRTGIWKMPVVVTELSLPVAIQVRWLLEEFVWRERKEHPGPVGLGNALVPILGAQERQKMYPAPVLLKRQLSNTTSARTPLLHIRKEPIVSRIGPTIRKLNS